MGGRHSAFTVHELEDYQELTFFTKKEILHVHKRFSQLAPDEVKADKNAKVPKQLIMDLPELKVNPFRDRICSVFSSCQDSKLSFEDFLDMMSVFSDNCPKNVKVEYAFRIYDFDGDDMINKEDLKKVIKRLTGIQILEPTDMQQLINNILEEADLDDDQALSFAEFEHVISKAPDFVNAFRIRL
ncbi:Calcium and integrin-binding protein 1 [Lamellibrachia satsuma]|nr:Calcium and integrin-binding protein 1 [Lamellibrachia satsuma]